MSVRIACIVEGQGDVASVPIIVRRVAEAAGIPHVDVSRPLRVRRSQVVRQGEIERAVELSARRVGPAGAILVLLDADDDPPCVLGPELLGRAHAARPNVPSSVVLANAEKEAWFIAAIESLRGVRGIPGDAAAPEDPESIRGAKEWIGRLMGGPYSEVRDQPALAARFDMGVARSRSPSFDKFCREVERLLGPSVAGGH